MLRFGLPVAALIVVSFVRSLIPRVRLVPLVINAVASVFFVLLPLTHLVVYCHFSAMAVRVGDAVRRGQRIGTVGMSGQRASPGFEHVHLEVQRGADVNAIEDPRVLTEDARRAVARAGELG